MTIAHSKAMPTLKNRKKKTMVDDLFYQVDEPVRGLFNRLEKCHCQSDVNA